MKTLIILLFILNSFVFASMKTIYIGILINKLENKNFINLAVRVLEKDFKNKLNKEVIKIKLYNDKSALLKDFAENKIKLMITHPFFYFENKNFIDKYQNYIWFSSSNENKMQEYYLISNSKAKNVLENLSKYKLITIGADQNSFIWFKYLYYKKFKKKPEILNHTYLTKESKIIYNVFFNKNTLAVVSKSAYNLMLELNPQLKHKTKVVKKSKEIFLQLLGFNHFTLNKKEITVLENASKNLNDILGASQLSDISKIKLFLDFENNELEIINKFYNEYKKLDKKYDK